MKTFNKIYLSIIGSFLFNTTECLSQNRADYHIKDQYDITYYSNSISNAFGLSPDFTNDNFMDDLGQKLSYVMKSLLEMYKTTNDKAYLLKFIHLSYQIQNWRNDITGPPYQYNWENQTYGWIYYADYMMEDGLIIMPMSEFVYIVIMTMPLHKHYSPLQQNLIILMPMIIRHQIQ